MKKLSNTKKKMAKSTKTQVHVDSFMTDEFPLLIKLWRVKMLYFVFVKLFILNSHNYSQTTILMFKLTLWAKTPLILFLNHYICLIGLQATSGSSAKSNGQCGGAVLSTSRRYKQNKRRYQRLHQNNYFYKCYAYWNNIGILRSSDGRWN